MLKKVFLMGKNPINLEKIAASLGEKIRWKKYRMWHEVPHVRNTALVVDQTIPRGGQYLLRSSPYFPARITEAYVRDAIRHDAYSLGRLTERGHFIPWNELVGDYPPGYFSHRIGEDVDCR